MSIPTPTRVAAGIANYDAWTNFLVAYGAWLNEVPLVDLDADAVRSQHVVRPVFSGFPNQEFTGERQIVKRVQFGLEARSAISGSAWANRPRLTIPPMALRREETASRWVSPLGFRVYFVEQASVTIRMEWEWMVKTITNAGAYTTLPTYPNSSDGTDQEAGYFSLLAKRRWNASGESVAGDLNEQPRTRNWVYPLLGDAIDNNGPSGKFTYDSGYILWANDCAAGTWDFYLGYTGPSANVNDLVQLDISAFSGTLTALM